MKNILRLFSILLLFVSLATSQTQIVPRDVVVRLRSQAQMTYVNLQVLHNEEYAAAVISNGSVVNSVVSNRGGTFSLPPGIMLLLHTHPYGTQPVPSDADKATAKKIAAPNCVVTEKEVWCAMPNGKIVPGVLLAGQPTAQTAGVEVQVYDYASLQPSTSKKFAQGTIEILSGTGISINVGLCERTYPRFKEYC